jgi:hypothetical protein
VIADLPMTAMTSMKVTCRLVSPMASALLTLALLTSALLAAGTPAQAQPAMPNLRTMSGKPLAVPDLPPGTVTIRLARKTPANPAAGIEITATTKGANGDVRARTAKTGSDGRATFEGLATGAEFQASATVDGERLETSRFPVPGTGGTRVMLIAGLGSADSAGEAGEAAADPHAGGGNETFRMGAPTGMVAPAADLPKGTLELELKDAAGKPLTQRLVRLGEIRLTDATTEGASRHVSVHDGTTDAAGKVRFDNLTTGESAGYAAISDYEGVRISTVPFRMPPDTGMRGNILALGRTRDPSVLRLDSSRTKIVVDLREDALAIMIALYIHNPSKEMFDNGEEGLFVPFPEGAVNAQEIEGGEPIEIVPGKGVRLKTPIAPDTGAQFMTQMRYGYILPADGERVREVRQVLPIGLSDPFLLVPASTGLELSGDGVKSLPPDKDGRGDKVNQYTTHPIPAGGTLALTVSGIPGRDRTGRTIASILVLGLLGVGVVLARTGRKPGSAGGVSANDLVDKREHIFAELVEIERQRQSDGANPRLDERRRETVSRLESVYRELARLD